MVGYQYNEYYSAIKKEINWPMINPWNSIDWSQSNCVRIYQTKNLGTVWFHL